MKNLISVLLSSLLVAGLPACSKDSDKNVSAPDVYVTGVEHNGSSYVAKVWNKDTTEKLTSGGPDAETAYLFQAMMYTLQEAIPKEQPLRPDYGEVVLSKTWKIVRIA